MATGRMARQVQPVGRTAQAGNAVLQGLQQRKRVVKRGGQRV
jgi:hypothetical protein